jgi:hypothetical protein
LSDGTPPAQRAATGAAKKPTPLDPLAGPKVALAGRVVTMDETFTVKPDAIVYIDRGSIVAVQDRAQAAPPGFAGVTAVETGGTLFPGLIELHKRGGSIVWSPLSNLLLYGDTARVGPDHVAPRAAAQPLSKILQPVTLDPLTVADDRNFLKQIAAQPNVPEAVRTRLAELY